MNTNITQNANEIYQNLEFLQYQEENWKKKKPTELSQKVDI